MPAPKLFAVRDSPYAPPVSAEPSTPARRIALLVGGPSLKEDWSREREGFFDEVVSVNGAAFVFPCDYAVMVDSPLVKQITGRTKPAPRVALVTYQNAYKRTTDQMKLRCLQVPNIGKGVKHYTMPRALKFALIRAGEKGQVWIFGMDFSDSKHDVAGVKGERSQKRWEQEACALRVIWDKRVAVVHGKISASRLAFIRSEVPTWPG
jgi:hypothetical protein